MARIANWFHNTFGAPRTTHVANAFDEEIQVKVLPDSGSATDVKVHAGPVAVGVRNDGRSPEPGFTPVPPGAFLAFRVAGDCGRVLVTVTAGARRICKNYQVLNNESVVVDPDGYLKKTRMGTIWTDTSGRKY